MHAHPKRTLFDIPVVSASLTEIPHIITSLASSQKKETVFYVNSHSIHLAHKDPHFKKILQKSSLVYADGFGPVLASRLLGHPLREKMTAPDFIYNVASITEKKGYSLYLLGSRKNIVQKAASSLKQQFPNLKVDFYHGFFTKKEENSVVKDINTFKPTFLLVGMGSPKQEQWIQKNKERVNARVFWAVGALFEYLSRDRFRGPFWMNQMGFEWVFRLLQEPRRLSRRYLVGFSVFFLLIAKELLKRCYGSIRR